MPKKDQQFVPKMMLKIHKQRALKDLNRLTKGSTKNTSYNTIK